LNVIHKNCDKNLAKDKSLPKNSYIIEYKIDNETTHDIVSASSFVEVFDCYYDELGKDCIVSIQWTEGKLKSNSK
jgi:hypothetical protein